MSRAENHKEAEKKSLETMKNSDGVNYCMFEQTPFELTDTESWRPEFEADMSADGMSFRFNPDDKTKNVIATRLGKDVAVLTDRDYEDFVKMSIEMALQSNH